MPAGRATPPSTHRVGYPADVHAPFFGGRNFRDPGLQFFLLEKFRFGFPQCGFYLLSSFGIPCRVKLVSPNLLHRVCCFSAGWPALARFGPEWCTVVLWTAFLFDMLVFVCFGRLCHEGCLQERLDLTLLDIAYEAGFAATIVLWADD